MSGVIWGGPRKWNPWRCPEREGWFLCALSNSPADTVLAGEFVGLGDGQVVPLDNGDMWQQQRTKQALLWEWGESQLVLGGRSGVSRRENRCGFTTWRKDELD